MKHLIIRGWHWVFFARFMAITAHGVPLRYECSANIASDSVGTTDNHNSILFLLLFFSHLVLTSFFFFYFLFLFSFSIFFLQYLLKKIKHQGRQSGRRWRWRKTSKKANFIDYQVCRNRWRSKRRKSSLNTEPRRRRVKVEKKRIFFEPRKDLKILAEYVNLKPTH